MWRVERGGPTGPWAEAPARTTGRETPRGPNGPRNPRVLGANRKGVKQIARLCAQVEPGKGGGKQRRRRAAGGKQSRRRLRNDSIGSGTEQIADPPGDR